MCNSPPKSKKYPHLIPPFLDKGQAGLTPPPMDPVLIVQGALQDVLDLLNPTIIFKAMKSCPLLGPFCGSEFWGFSLLKI